MRGPIRSVLLAAVAACAFAALTVGSASGALLGQPANTAFLAIYGNPGANGPGTTPVGGGLGRNFGFGENMLFEANTTAGVGKNLKYELDSGGVKVLEGEVREVFLGGTLMSNKTGANNPVSFAVQFGDFQRSFVGTTEVPWYTDTHDRQWVGEICPLVVGATCTVDPRVAGNALGEVKIENVSFDIGPSTVLQGTVWGKWHDGKVKEGKTEPACITLNLPPAPAGVEADRLYETQGANVGAQLQTITGELCLLSANNDWEEGKTTVITLGNGS